MVNLSDVFTIEICKNPLSKSFVDANPGSTPYVTTSSKNNGISGYVNVEPDYPGNVITVSKDGGNADAFVQPYPFCGNEKVMILTPIQKMSIEELLYYTVYINANKPKFSYGRKCSKERVGEIKVPILEEIRNQLNKSNIKQVQTNDINNIPDYFLDEGYERACWYMDNIEVEKFEHKYKKEATSNKSQKQMQLNIEEWKEFRLGELFNVYTGGDLVMSSLNEGDINVISHSKINNGVCTTTQELEGRKLFSCQKTISLADRGNFFATIQPSDFYIATRVKALEAKFDSSNKYILMFIATIINLEEFRFCYGRNCCSGVEALTIKLPAVINDGNIIPDYRFMEEYIKATKFSIGI